MRARTLCRPPAVALALTLMLLLAGHSTALDLSFSQTDWSTAPPRDNVTAGQVVNVFVKLRVDGGDLPAGAVTVLQVNGTAVSWKNTTSVVTSGSEIPVWHYCVLPCGNISLSVVADPGGAIAETDESNNALTFHVMVLPCEDDGWEPLPDDDEDEGAKSLYDYIPYVFVGLVILVALLVALVLYMFERRRRDEAAERERLLRNR